jgi:putative transposase
LLTISRSSTCYTPVGFDQTIIYLMHEIERIFTKYPFWATARSSPTYLDLGFRQEATACVA